LHIHIDEFSGIQNTHNPHRQVLSITPEISTLGTFYSVVVDWQSP